MIIYLKGVVKTVPSKKGVGKKTFVVQLSEELGEGTIRLVTNKDYMVGDKIKIKVPINDYIEDFY
jgi:hypothetical protein